MKNNNSEFLYVPQHLIQEILLRLPVKSLVRFKCASKSWLCLISNPSFEKSHFELSTARPHRLLCYNREQLKFESVDPHTFFHDATTKPIDAVLDDSLVALAFRKGQIPQFLILGYCRGFILVQHDFEPIDLILWNPSTGARRPISYPHIDSSLRFRFRPYMAFLFGFGYDPSKDDYLVVIAWGCGKKEKHLQIFSVRTNSWQDLQVAVPDSYLRHSGSVYLNGAIHWLGRQDVIVVFDLIERKFSENIPLHLPKMEAMRRGHASLKVVGGCLSIRYHCNSPRDRRKFKIEVRVMKEYKVQSSWTVYEIFDQDFYPICLAKEGGEIIGLDRIEKLVKYDDEGKRLEGGCTNYRHMHDFVTSTAYPESLLSLPGDSVEADR